MTDTEIQAPAKVGSGNLIAALRARFAAPAFAFLEQVRNRTGYGGDIRTADALAMSLWPSRGLELHGFEVKVSRSDWTRELAAPDKADEIARYCDRWWVVVPKMSDIIHAGELPPTWGCLELRGKKLVAVVEAPKLDAAPPTKAMLCGILRNAADAQRLMVPKSEIQAEIAAAFDRGHDAGEKSTDYKTRGAQSALDHLRSQVASFEAASGVKIDTWNSGPIGEAVRFVLDGGIDRARRELDGLRSRADAIVKAIDALDTKGA